MTTANKVTICRILLTPFFVTMVIYYVTDGLEHYRFWAVTSFGVAALTDALDSYIARRYRQHSELGAFLDPLADKLLLVSGILLLSLDNAPLLDRLPLWLVATVIGRDVILLLGIVVIYYFCGRVAIAPRWISKAGTVLQIAVVLWALLKFDARWLEFWCAAAAITTGVSGVQYVFDGVRQLSASPSSTAGTKK
jgi:cardiolipin synthase (CMP-forming)